MLPYRIWNLMAHAFLALTACVCLCCNSNPQGNDDGDYPPQPAYAAYDKHPCWSGVHNLIAYVHDQQRSLNDPDSSGIYLINPDGTDRRLFFRGDWIRGLDWSPDGQWLVINIGSDLWKISYPDKVIDTLMQSGAYYYPSWSPDGMQITCSKRAGDERGVYILSDDGANYRLIIPYGDYPTWLYRDSVLYVNYSPEFPSGSLCISDSTGSFKRLFLDIEQYDLLWMRDAKAHIQTKRLACNSIVSGEPISIWIFDSYTYGLQNLFEGAFYPNLSPDGNQVVFTIFGPHYANLWIINWDGTGLRQLTEPLIP